MPSDPDPDERPVYRATTAAEDTYEARRVDAESFNVSVAVAEAVYDRLMDAVAGAVKDGEPAVVVVGTPQYKALWVYVAEQADSVERPEELVPLRMVVVPGPMLHVERSNVDVLYDSDAV